MSILQSPPAAPAPAPAPDGKAAQAAKPLLSDEEFQKIRDRQQSSYQKMERHRRVRLNCIKQYIGESYGGNHSEGIMSDTIVNMVDQMVDVLLQQLVSGTPQTLVLTQKVGMKTAIRYFELALNHAIGQIDLRDTLKFAVLESFFSMAIVKVGVENPEYTDKAFPFDASAYPFADAIFFEDWVHDTSAHRWEHCRFYGDKYKEHRDVVEADPRNDPDVLKTLDSGLQLSAFDTSGPEAGDQLDGGNSGPYDNDDRDFVTLWDLYLPRKRLLVTYLANGSQEKPLRVVRWTGPDEGPYIIGRYKCVPNQIMPKPPVMDIAAMADLHNKLWIKMGEQASRQKTNVFATLGGTKDAETVIRASDGEVIHVTHPDAIREASFGGVKQEMVTFAQLVKQEASYNAGNLDTMGGLASQADTLGQEQILQAGTSGRIRAMQTTVITLTKQVIRAIGWYLWNDPLVRISVTDKIPNTSIELEAQWPVQTDEYGQEVDLRKGEYNDLNFDIEPFSMVDQSPGTRLQLMRSILQQDFLPAMQLMQQQGLAIDWNEYVDKIETYANLPEFKAILKKVAPPPDPDTEPSNMGPTKPPTTTRQYDRVAKPTSPQDSSAKLISGMGGGDRPKTLGS